MAFLSGSFGPTRRYPEVLQWIADVLPLTYLIDLLKQVYLGGDSFFGHPKEIAIVAAWGSRASRLPRGASAGSRASADTPPGPGDTHCSQESWRDTVSEMCFELDSVPPVPAPPAERQSVPRT